MNLSLMQTNNTDIECHSFNMSKIHIINVAENKKTPSGVFILYKGVIFLEILKIKGIDFSDHLDKDGYKVQIQDIHSNESGISESMEEIVEVTWPDRHKINCIWKDIDPDYLIKISNAIQQKTLIPVECLDGLHGLDLYDGLYYIGNRELTMKGSNGSLWDLQVNLIEQRKKE